MINLSKSQQESAPNNKAKMVTNVDPQSTGADISSRNPIRKKNMPKTFPKVSIRSANRPEKIDHKDKTNIYSTRLEI